MTDEVFEEVPEVYRVYVPAPGKLPYIARGSAIIGLEQHDRGTQQDDDRVLIYYEGNIYGFDNLKNFCDRCVIAFNRLTTRYPTTAMAVVPREALIDVGYYSGIRVHLGAEEPLREWLEMETVPFEELCPSWAFQKP